MSGLFNYQIPKKIKGKYTDAQKWNYYKSKTEPKLYDQLYTASIPEDESSLLRTVREIKELFQEFKTKNKTITHDPSEIEVGYDPAEIHSIEEVGLPPEVKIENDYENKMDVLSLRSRANKKVKDEEELKKIIQDSYNTKDPLEGKKGRPYNPEKIQKNGNILQNAYKQHKARGIILGLSQNLDPEKYFIGNKKVDRILEDHIAHRTNNGKVVITGANTYLNNLTRLYELNEKQAAERLEKQKRFNERKAAKTILKAFRNKKNNISS